MWWNDEVKATVRRKEAARKEMLAAGNEEEKERLKVVYIKTNRK